MQIDAHTFRGLPKGSSLMVALSGGVDSAVAAHLCIQSGFKVMSATMRLFEGAADTGASFVASRLGIPHSTLDLSEDFTRLVLRPAWSEYSSGRTPNPCAVCNPSIKFGLLLDYALSQGCAGLVTGHYARIALGQDGSLSLSRAAHRQKDQTYFLFALSRQQLERSFMPLGGMEKSQVRKLAASLGLPNAARPESQDACFAADGARLPEKLKALFGAEPKPGDVIDESGRVIGSHKGIYAYTIGQRKGLGVAAGVPAYVSRIDCASNSITLSSSQDSLFASQASLSNPNWILEGYSRLDSFDCQVQVRYRANTVPAKITRQPDSSLKAEFSTPIRAVTPGQAAVLYHGDSVIGGAWIESAST